VSDISDVPQLERVPERIKSFYRINNVNRFHYDRPFHKGPKDRENEFRVRPVELDSSFQSALPEMLLHCLECTAFIVGVRVCVCLQSLWIERTTLILTRPLPGIARWSEVERRELVRNLHTHVLTHPNVIPASTGTKLSDDARGSMCDLVIQ